jgi:hypothetical protein
VLQEKLMVDIGQIYSLLLEDQQSNILLLAEIPLFEFCLMFLL